MIIPVTTQAFVDVWNPDQTGQAPSARGDEPQICTFALRGVNGCDIALEVKLSGRKETLRHA